VLKPRRWPIPGDSERDRSRHVAQAYRAALEREAPEVCADLDTRFRDAGERWVVPEILHVDLDGFLSAGDMAEFLHVDVQVVRQWAYRGHLTRFPNARGRVEYSIREAIEYQATLRVARAARQSGRRVS
jgi:hypothetical protein